MRKPIARAVFDHAQTKGNLSLVHDGEGYSIREGLLYKPMGHNRLRVLTLFAKGTNSRARLTDKAEALRRFDLEVNAMGAQYV